MKFKHAQSSKQLFSVKTAAAMYSISSEMNKYILQKYIKNRNTYWPTNKFIQLEILYSIKCNEFIVIMANKEVMSLRKNKKTVGNKSIE